MLLQQLAGERIKQRQGIDFVVEQLDSDRFHVGIAGEHVDQVTAHAVGAAAQLHVIARVLHFRQLAQHAALIHALPALEMQTHVHE